MVAGEPERGGGGGEAGGERPAAWPSASASVSGNVARGGAVVSSSGVGVAEGDVSGDALCAMYMAGRGRERKREAEGYRLTALSVPALCLRIECGTEGERGDTERERRKRKVKKRCMRLDALSEVTVV